tara:strand:- start:1339 stop:2652 length:1314 start_codon:yes stop_codon:yes gene_type:complete
MDLLQNFSEIEIDFIVKNGIILFENSKKYFKNNILTLDEYSSTNYEFEIKEKNNMINKLHESINNFEHDKQLMRQNNDKERSQDKKYFMDQIDELKTEKKQIISLFENNVREKVAWEVTKYKAEIDEKNSKINDLEKKNKHYFDLYESKDKGMNFENEIYPLLLEYNDKHLNSVWNITHVGQVLSEKADFHFQHKLLNKIIIVDTKNNISNNPVNNTSLEKFERDICSEKTNSIGGILLAKEKICKKKNFEINKINNKYAFYVSNFNISNVSFLFSLLDQILELNSNKSDINLIENKLKTVYIENYKHEKTKLDKLERDKKESMSRLNSIIYDFREIFDEDIDFVLNSKGIKDSSSSQKEKNIEEIIDYEELEENKKIVNKITNDNKSYRTKYYYCYKDKNGDECLQYFKNNYARNKKIQSLNSSEKNVINFSTSSS